MLYNTLHPVMIYGSGLKKENLWCIILLSLNWELNLWEIMKAGCTGATILWGIVQHFLTQIFQILVLGFPMENIFLLPSLLPRNHLDIKFYLFLLNGSEVKIFIFTCYYHNTWRHQEKTSCYYEVKPKIDYLFLLAQIPVWKL